LRNDINDNRQHVTTTIENERTQDHPFLFSFVNIGVEDNFKIMAGLMEDASNRTVS